jgi:hypothetical protein
MGHPLTSFKVTNFEAALLHNLRLEGIRKFRENEPADVEALSAKIEPVPGLAVV